METLSMLLEESLECRNLLLHNELHTPLSSKFINYTIQVLHLHTNFRYEAQLVQETP